MKEFEVNSNQKKQQQNTAFSTFKLPQIGDELLGLAGTKLGDQF